MSNASAKLFPESALGSFTNFMPDQLNLERQWEIEISEKSYPSMYQNNTCGKFLFLATKLLNSSDFFYLEPGLYVSVPDIVEAMNTLRQERHNHTEHSLALKVSLTKKQKVWIYLANEKSCLVFFSTDLGHFFESIIAKEFGVLLRRERPH